MKNVRGPAPKRRFLIEERKRLKQLLEESKSIPEIASLLNRSRSSIWGEIHRYSVTPGDSSTYEPLMGCSSYFKKINNKVARRLSLDERIKLKSLLIKDLPIYKVAQNLERSFSTISYELLKSGFNRDTYDPHVAHERGILRRNLRKNVPRLEGKIDGIEMQLEIILDLLREKNKNG